MLEAEKEGSKSSNDANAKLFNNHANRDAKINIGAKPGDRKKNRKFDNREGVQINNKGNFNGDGNGGVVNGDFNINK